MKALNHLATCICASLLAGAALAQAQTSPASPSPSAPPQGCVSPSSDTKQLACSKELVGAEVRDVQGRKAGNIAELYRNPQTGAVLAIVDIPGSRNAVVPLQELKVTPSDSPLRNSRVTLNTTRASLVSGPTVTRKERQKLDSPQFNQQVYAHYNLQPPSSGTPVGAGELLASTSSGAPTSSPELIPHEDRPPW